MPMKTKLVWPATLLASFALAAACGGGTTDGDGEGGQGGTDGSTGGSGTGGTGTGGSAEGGLGGQGGLGGGRNVIVPETCSDEIKNEDETDVDCGGPDCDPCQEDAACAVGADCTSGHCADEVCLAPVCGDSIVNGDEQCDPGRETDDCDEDCTFSECGDGYLNSRVEECEPDPDLGIWQRCGRTCIHGADLDGTWRTNDLPGTDSPWEMLSYLPGTQYRWLPSFHYIEEPSIVELMNANRYDIASDAWVPLAADPYAPGGGGYNGSSSDGENLWIVVGSTMYTFDLGTETWTAHTPNLPDVSAISGSTVVHDGDGFIWYVGYDSTFNSGVGENVLVRFDPQDGSFQSYSWATDVPGYVADEERMAYDPITDAITFGSYWDESTFLTFDLAGETFAEGAALPDGGTITDSTCQDRAGGIYVLSSIGFAYRYDIAANEYEILPDLPAPHDDNSSCVVSEVGYLYYGTSSGGPTGYGLFSRLRLNSH